MFEVSVEQTFAAGHALRNYHGKCENVHGHNYKVRITVQGEKLDDNGLLVDFVQVKSLMRNVYRVSRPPLHQRPPSLHGNQSRPRKTSPSIFTTRCMAA